jgi:2-isopropylmalate synthase
MPKYQATPRVKMNGREWPDRVVTTAPIWCSVDLRDGNQALVNPMGIESKLKMFDLLVKTGFKEIEVGFPSASQTEYSFARRLIDEDRVPGGVAIQVLCQARRHLIERTMESLRGAKRAIFHLYNSTSPIQRMVTFGMSKDEIVRIAVHGVRDIKEFLPMVKGTDFALEYSPESFSDTEPEFAVEICEAVMEAWEPSRERPIILNLPSTVESAPPNVYADQVETFRKKLSSPSCAVISVHTHNDRGNAVAEAELALAAGARRVEGTLFGNGERTGNLDVVTLGLNLMHDGVDPGLDLSDIPALSGAYRELTGMDIPLRQPYSGELVFTAFSGSHQDAIKKGLDRRAGFIAAGAEAGSLAWEVPYLPIDPADIGRGYEPFIRVNSQSGKGGVAFVLKERYGLDLPKAMHPEVGAIVQKRADETGAELGSEEIYGIFEAEYLKSFAPAAFESIRETEVSPDGYMSVWETRLIFRAEEVILKGKGNGPIDAFMRSIGELGYPEFHINAFHEHSLEHGADSRAVAYVEVERADGARFWGCGIDASIATAGVKAAVSAANRASLDWEKGLERAGTAKRKD